MATYRMKINLGKFETQTDDDLFELCVQNKTAWIERDESGELFFYAPKGLETASQFFNLIASFILGTKKRKKELHLMNLQVIFYQIHLCVAPAVLG